METAQLVKKGFDKLVDGGAYFPVHQLVYALHQLD